MILLKSTKKSKRFLYIISTTGNVKMKSKKSQALAGVLIVVIIVVALIFLITSCERGECSKDTDCPPEYICKADRSCHPIPSINKTIINYDLRLPALILGLAIVIAAILIRQRKKPPRATSIEITARSPKASKTKQWTRPFQDSRRSYP